MTLTTSGSDWYAAGGFWNSGAKPKPSATSPDERERAVARHVEVDDE